MSISPIDSTTPTGATAGLQDATVRAARQQQLRKTVDELVGTVFFGPVFKAMRESRLKGPYGHGGQGEAIFNAQLHGILAKKIGQSGSFGINEALYRRFEKLA